MNRKLTLAFAVLAGFGFGACLSIRPTPAAATTLYGNVAKPGLQGQFPVTVELRSPESDNVLYKRETTATVRDGRYMAELGSGIPDGLYVVNMAAPNGAALQAATFVELQTNSPGTKQTGNVNISGTLLAGKIGVPSVNNGAMINALGTGGVIGIRGQSDGTGVVGASGAAGGTGVSGVVTANSGAGTGVVGFNSSPEGTGVRGSGGPGVGVRGQSTSGSLAAVVGSGVGLGGLFIATADGAFGVKGEASGPKGRGVVGAGEFGVVGSGKIGVSGDGVIGVNGLGSQAGGSFESTGVEGIAVKADTSESFGVGVKATSLGAGSIGVVGSGTANGGNFFSNGDASAAVKGENRGTGVSFGADFESTASEGRGVRGKASSTSGANFGGWFTSASTNGTGAIGTVNSATGNTIGLYGTVNSSAGKGVVGEATSQTGTTFGGDFFNNSTSGSGIRAKTTATSGFTKAGEFINASPAGSAIFALSTASSGNPIVIQGTASAANATGAFFNISAATGASVGIRCQVASATGKGLIAQNLNSGVNVELASPNGSVFLNKGHVTKQTGNEVFNITPIAYGMIGSAGTKLGGTNNFSVSQIQSTKAYVIHLTTNEQMSDNDFSIQIQQFGSVGTARLLPIVDFENQDPTSFVVHFQNENGFDASARFMFTVFAQTLPPANPGP